VNNPDGIIVEIVTYCRAMGSKMAYHRIYIGLSGSHHSWQHRQN